jgi:NAD(P)-dependent dehydrogenase (short-subunit alcohol dehydrogenase family)
MDRFEGKVVIVTGGGSGIGRATVEEFAREGAAVVIAEIDEETGRDAERTLSSHGGRAVFLRTDVANESDINSMVAKTVSAFGRIDILVNNAAVFILKGIEGTTEDWRKILDVNVVGVAMVTKHVVPEMRKVGGGAIVNLGSISSFIAQPNFWTYNAAKGAIAQLTRCMALDLADDHIRVNAVCPGAVWTQIVQKITDEMGLDRAGADAHPEWGGAHMLKRIADPVEIARAILFLASDDASFITAENLMVDGGYVAR